VGCAPKGRALLVLPGGKQISCYDGHIYFEKNRGTRQNIYFGRHFAWLKYFTYQLSLSTGTGSEL
jgi:hypothetical protein